MASPGTIKKALAQVAAFFDVSMDQLAPKVGRYAHAFADMEDEDLLRGAWHIMETWRRPGIMPTIADFREACGTDVKKRSREAWVVVQDKMRGNTSSKLDPIAKKALDNIGGLGTLSHSHIDDQWRLRSEFLDRYELYSREMPIKPERTLPAAEPKQLQSREEDIAHWAEMDAKAAAVIDEEDKRIANGEPATEYQGFTIGLLAILKIYNTDFCREIWEAAAEQGLI